MAKANPLERIFRSNAGRLIYKWRHYFDIYDRHFARFRKKRITVVEFGVWQGGSLRMWHDYFGKKARIIGVDFDERCLQFAEPGIEIVIGDQEDRAFLRELRSRIGAVDVLIEDGGHRMTQQIATFEEFWPAIAEGGVFLIEDLHTSYWEDYGGGYRRPGTFIEYAKDLIDRINAHHSRGDDGLEVNRYTQTITGMHVYDSVIVFDKGTVIPPTAEMTGTPIEGWD